MAEQNEHFIKCLLENIPNYVFWKDENLVFKWCNKKFAQQFGYENPEEIIGKTDYDFPWSPELRDKYIRDDKEVLSSDGGRTNYEEEQRQPDGSIKTLLVSKTPIRNESNKAVGILGIYIDITDRKQKERLHAESEAQKVKISEQGIFKKEIGKLVHDVSTPLGTIQMILEVVRALIPEQKRLSMLNAIGTMKGIFDNLRSRYKGDKEENQVPKPIIISLLLSQVSEGKKVLITNAQIEFTYDFDDCHFSFIKVNQLALRRSITNLINNAVDAMDRKGTIHFGLNKKDGSIKLTIKDNGKGMPQDVLDKLRNNIAVTSGKEDGHGIGFTQIRETIEKNNGTIDIDSVPNQGTTITITFPEIESASWIIKELRLNQKDILVILDDDTDIHGAWDAKFQKYDVSIKHFTIGSEAVNFINSFPDKNKIFLLADFELLEQELSGIDVIKKTCVRSVLVTSHYGDEYVLKLVMENNIKVLPKQLAAEVTIITDNSSSEKIDVVIVDIIKCVADMTALTFRNKNKKADVYCSLDAFLQNASKYDQSTIILMDDFEDNKLNSLDVLKQLHNRGFTRLYLLSGSELEKNKIPKYVTFISRDNDNAIIALADG
ncbi:hypothetical protein GAMM_40003 [Gammaproteobacteria bacterium]